MRLVAGIALAARGLVTLLDKPPVEPAILAALAITAGTLLVIGLWTPFSGSAVALLGAWEIVSRAGNHWAGILLATLGLALALLGPGAWSVDARLFGWKRIGVRDRKS